MCVYMCVYMCVCKQRDGITGSVMLHIMANEAGDIQTFYICKLKHHCASLRSRQAWWDIYDAVLAPSAHFQQLQLLMPAIH